MTTIKQNYSRVEYNPFMIADSYKYSHPPAYPTGATYMMSYLEARTGGLHKKVRMGTLLYILRRFLSTPATMKDLEELVAFAPPHGIPAPIEAFRKMQKKYNGYFPVYIRAVPEGTEVDVGNVLVTIESTDPEFFWVPSFLETMLVRIWYGCNVATIDGEILSLGWMYGKKTMLPEKVKQAIMFFLNDFGMRGASSLESAGIAGMTHLEYFMGTDNVEGIRYARNYLDFLEMCGFSIPALEHSVVSMYGKDKEAKCYEAFFNEYAKNYSTEYPGKFPLLACVSDTYDYKNTVENIWCKQLKDMVVNSGSKLVIRPDSGDPVKLIPWTLKKLEEAYGYDVNELGYKVIRNVGVIQGDGVNAKAIDKIMGVVTNDENKYAMENVVFGMGGDLVQNHNRDTDRFAQKCCSAQIDGIMQEVRKMPKTDPSKNSKGGLLELIYEEGVYRTYRRDQLVGRTSELQDMYLNGELLCGDTLQTIRDRIQNQIFV